MLYGHKLMSLNDNKVARFTMDIQLSDNIIETKDGYLLCKNVIMGRTGYYKYLGSELTGLGFGASEVVEVFRGEDEVFHIDALNSALGKPVTLDHPDEDVTIDNIKYLSKGYIVGVPIRVGEDVVGDIMITDKELKRLILSKRLRELSLGYRTKLVRDGDYVKQTQIYINHLAVVDQGRAGNAMIVDKETVNEKGGVELLEKLKNGIHVTINLGDLEKKEKETKAVDVDEETKEETKKEKEVKETKDEETKGEENKKEEADKDETSKETKHDEKVDDEDKDKKDKEAKKADEKENKTMDLKTLFDAVANMTPEQKAEFSKLVGQEMTASANDSAFAGTNPVNNTIETSVKDYSAVKGDEFEKALQSFHDKRFSFRAMFKATDGDSKKLKSYIYNQKDIEDRDFLGGNE